MPLAVSQDCGHGHDVFVDYFRCPEPFGVLRTAQKPSAEAGYFALGDAVAFGRLCCDGVNASPQGHLHDASQEVTFSAEGLCLPFDINEVVTNLRQERYHQPAGNYLGRMTATRAIQHLYYFMRPALPVEIRRHLQRVRLSGWQEIAFPQWPVDTSVDRLMRTTLGLMLRKTGISAIPFVWFWPDGAPSCVVMTHDVEGPVGGSLCETLMDLDDSFGMKSAFQIVPEMRGQAWTSEAVQAGMVVRFDAATGAVSGIDDIRPGFVKRDEIAWAGTHRNGPEGMQVYIPSYLFAYTINLPPGSREIRLPNESRVRILAITALNDANSVKPATVLYSPELGPEGR